jgi:uridylate kinase
MKKQIIVLSLGGSIIVPDKINSKFLLAFKKTLIQHTKNYKFVIVCGGGSTARKYIQGLKDINANNHLQSFAGISATRMNARFVSYFFNQNPERGIPHKKREIKKYLKRQDIVFCGALEYEPNQTSDSTAAKIANYFNTSFINLTNIKGLYTDNPLKNKKAKFIPEISWKNFKKMANKIKFAPGQHFVLDQTAAEMILKNKTKTYILGPNIKNLNNFLNRKDFIGTTIQN